MKIVALGQRVSAKINAIRHCYQLDPTFRVHDHALGRQAQVNLPRAIRMGRAPRARVLRHARRRGSPRGCTAGDRQEPAPDLDRLRHRRRAREGVRQDVARLLAQVEPSLRRADYPRHPLLQRSGRSLGCRRASLQDAAAWIQPRKESPGSPATSVSRLAQRGPGAQPRRDRRPGQTLRPVASRSRPRAALHAEEIELLLAQEVVEPWEPEYSQAI
jgi:hypothetical protein